MEDLGTISSLDFLPTKVGNHRMFQSESHFSQFIVLKITPVTLENGF